jgi:hypothetical protein
MFEYGLRDTGHLLDLIDKLEELMLLVRYHVYVQPEYLLTVCHATGYHLVKKS